MSDEKNAAEPPGASGGSGVCPYVTGTVTRYCTLTPLTLTEGERLAIKTALVYLKEDEELPGIAEDKAALRGLLERLA